MYFKNFLYHELPVYRIESVFKVNFQNYVIFGFSIKQRKTCEANSAPLLVPTPTCRFPHLACRDSKTWHPAHFADNRRKVLPTVIGRTLHRAFLAQLVSHQRSTVEVRKVLFLRESHSQDLIRL